MSPAPRLTRPVYSFTPVGFQRPVIQGRRARVIPFRRRGLGDTAADAANYAKMAASLPANSFIQQAALNCAQNPTPTCATASQSWFNAPYFTAADAATAAAGVAAGNIPFIATQTGPPPGTYIPTPAPPPAAPPTPPVTVVKQPSAPAPTVSAPAPSPSPTTTKTAGDSCVPCLVPGPPPCCGSPTTGASGFLSAPVLGFPLWAWGLAAVAGYFLFAGGQHGR